MYRMNDYRNGEFFIDILESFHFWYWADKPSRLQERPSSFSRKNKNDPDLHLNANHPPYVVCY